MLTFIGRPVTQREVARRARFQHRTVQLALDDLVDCGVVTRIEGGRDFLVSLNREHRLASTLEELFRREAEHFLELRRELSRAVAGPKMMKKDILSLALFGSVARSEDALKSDLDVLCITPNERARGSTLERTEASSEDLCKRFGARLRPIAYTLTEARRLWRAHRAPLPEAVRDAVVLAGPPLRQLLSGKS